VGLAQRMAGTARDPRAVRGPDPGSFRRPDRRRGNRRRQDRGRLPADRQQPLPGPDRDWHRRPLHQPAEGADQRPAPAAGAALRGGGDRVGTLARRRRWRGEAAGPRAPAGDPADHPRVAGVDLRQPRHKRAEDLRRAALRGDRRAPRLHRLRAGPPAAVHPPPDRARRSAGTDAGRPQRHARRHGGRRRVHAPGRRPGGQPDRVGG
jgi:hypothetical protein